MDQRLREQAGRVRRMQPGHWQGTDGWTGDGTPIRPRWSTTHPTWLWCHRTATTHPSGVQHQRVIALLVRLPRLALVVAMLGYTISKPAPGQ